MKFGIYARDIMKKNFNLVSSSDNLINCVKIMDKDNVCLIFKKGNIFGVITEAELLEGFMNGIEKIEEITNKNLAFIDADSDIIKLFDLMNKKNVGVVIVRKEDNIVGIITKKEIGKIEQELFDKIEGNVRRFSRRYLTA